MQRNAEQPDDPCDGVMAHGLRPENTRLHVALALSKTRSTKDMQRIFWAH